MQHRFWILAALSLVALPAGALAAVPMLPGTGGVTFVAGGHVYDDDADLWGAYAAYARAVHGQKKPKVAVFCTARDSFAQGKKAYFEDAPGAWSYQHVFRHYGLDPVFVPIAIDNYRTAAKDPKNVALLKGASAVWFGGGGQNLHARCLLNDDGSDSPLMAAVRQLHRDGAIVGGTSAGAAIMDRLTYGDGESYDYLLANRLVSRGLTSIKAADSPFGDGKTGGYTRGFDLLTSIDAGTDTHVDARGRYGRVIVAMRTLKYPFGLAIAEDTALAVRGRQGVAYGRGHVFIADGRQARYRSEGPYGVSGLMVNLVAPHSRFDFDSGRVTSPDAAIAPIRHGLPSCDGDPLNGAALPRDMVALATSEAQSLRCATRLDTAVGFELTLTKTPTTRAFGDGSRVSVQGLGLTVAPLSTPRSKE